MIKINYTEKIGKHSDFTSKTALINFLTASNEANFHAEDWIMQHLSAEAALQSGFTQQEQAVEESLVQHTFSLLSQILDTFPTPLLRFQLLHQNFIGETGDIIPPLLFNEVFSKLDEAFLNELITYVQIGVRVHQ